MVLDLTIAVPVIMALVQGFKGLGLPSKYAFLVAMAIGSVSFTFLGEGEMAMRVFEGIVAGLTASGLYSGVKSMVTT